MDNLSSPEKYERDHISGFRNSLGRSALSGADSGATRIMCRRERSRSLKNSLTSSSSSLAGFPKGGSPLSGLGTRAAGVLLTPKAGMVTGTMPLSAPTSAGSSGISRNPATPTRPLTTKNMTPTPQPWTHPRLTEIINRNNKNRFSGENLRSILLNLTFFIIFLIILPANLQNFPSIISQTISLVFLINTILAIRPLFSTPDPILDIPLTPSQRSLLNLPSTPTSLSPRFIQHYITPPRLVKSSPNSSRPSPPPSRYPSLYTVNVTSRGASSSDSATPTHSPVNYKWLYSRISSMPNEKRLYQLLPSPSPR